MEQATRTPAPIRRPTLRDVGAAADVSICTVSRALADKPGVAASTRARVRTAAEQLGYIPNQLARGLRGHRSRGIGVLAVHTSNHYYAGLVSSIEHDLRAHGYHCIVMDAVVDGEYHLDRETAYVGDLLEHQVSAVIATYAIAPHSLAALEARGTQLVFVDTDAPHPESASVNSDNYAGAFELGMHVAAHGYPGPWVFVAYPGDRSSRLPREAGFVDAASTAGVEVETVEGGTDEASAYLAVAAYLDRREGAPRVLFAGNELMLLGALRALRERGLRVPEDVAVVSYDDFNWAPFMSPPLTVVDQEVARIGSAAAGMLVELLRSDGQQPRGPGAQLVLPTRLVVRESCGEHPARGRRS